MIPYEDFGGHGPVLHFAHPNAYPPATFRGFLEPLTSDYHVLAMAQRPLWPGSDPAEFQDWALFADDLLDFLDQQGLSSVIGVGHSLGAVATMFAARRQPERFRALVLIEPVFMPRELLQQVPDGSDGLTHSPMAKIARKRRRSWPSRDAAFTHFRSKNVFQRWSDAALRDFIHAGLRPDGDDVSLVYPPEWEAQIYSHIPVTVWDEVPHLTQPTLAIRAAESDTLFSPAWQLWQSLQPEAQFVELPDAGHMVPLERPAVVAETILSFLRGLPRL